MRKGKNIGLFLLWLAGLVIFSHEVIPHHHHFHSVYSPIVDSHNEVCQHSNQQDGPFDDAENHCHAFNDITVERQNAVKISQPQVISFPGLLVAIVVAANYDEDSGVDFPYYYPDDPDTDRFILSIAPHRGPPVA